jgi:hypothetical protein
MVPTQITLDIVNVATSAGTLRRLADVRPTTRSKQTAGLLSAATTAWGKLETGTTVQDAALAMSTVAPAMG